MKIHLTDSRGIPFIKGDDFMICHICGQVIKHTEKLVYEESRFQGELGQFMKKVNWIHLRCVPKNAKIEESL